MSLAKPISIRSHSFPSFYACYLLKSLRIPNTRPTYIGSTPSPPRRIRQHNGELAQGARKTRLNRPWVMQMIVHGLPSRLAALQFEWAWQHPRISRHMRDSKIGSRLKALQKSILTVRALLSRRPFNTWPLHVKLFTHEAEQYWKDSMTNDVVSPLPPGFTCTLELEGVDGKSGHVGSGRQGPISVDDEDFASKILAKNTVIAAAGGNVECSICREPILNYAVSPLSTALCPSSNCHAVSHLKCLSQYFVNQQDQPTTIIPRGGHCKSCKEYILWGDVIRGCYRLYSPIGYRQLDIDDDVDNLEVQETRSSLRRKKSASRSRKILEVPSPPTIRRLPSKGSRKRKPPSDSVFTTEGETVDLVASSEIEDNATSMKRKPGRPRKDLAILSPGASSSVSLPHPLKASRKPKKDTSPAKLKLPSTMKRKPGRLRKDLAILSSGASSSISSSHPLEASRKPKKDTSPAKLKLPSTMKRKPGRPRKNPAILSSGASSSVSSPHPLKASRKKDTSPAKLKLPPTMKRKPGRPRKDPAILSSGASSSVSSPHPLKASRKPKKDTSPAKLKLPSTMKRKPGRPRKGPAILSSGASSSVSSPYPLKASIKPKKSASPASTKLRLSSKGKVNRSSSSLSASEGENTKKKAKAITPTNCQKKKPNKNEPSPE